MNEHNARHFMTIRFLRDCETRYVSWRAGDCWTMPADGEYLARAEAIRRGDNGAMVRITGGKCYVSDLELIYDGPDLELAYRAGRELRTGALT